MRLVIDTFEFGAQAHAEIQSDFHQRAITSAKREIDRHSGIGLQRCATESSTSEWGIRRGLAVDDFAPALSFFFNAHNDFFEEIAKYRAARRIWYKTMTGRTLRREIMARSSAACAFTRRPPVYCSPPTAQQPYNNVVRTADAGALAAVIWAARNRFSHTNSLDEACQALPTGLAATLALGARRSRFWRMKPAWPTRSIHLAARTSLKR